MWVCVLAAAESWYVGDLRRAAEARDVQITALPFSRLVGGWSTAVGEWQGSRGVVFPEIEPTSTVALQSFDAVLVRSMPPGSLEQVVFRTDTLHRLEAGGTVVVNPPRSLEYAIDKYLAAARLRTAGLPVPDSLACQTWQQALQGFHDLSGDVVVKPLFGSEGRGILRVSDEDLAVRVFKTLERLGHVILLQPYIEHHGYDVRLLVIDDEVFAIRRVNDDDWRTNVSRGALAQPYEPSAAQIEWARVAAAELGTPLAGVDILPGKDGRDYVLEVNGVPGWKAAAKALKIDFADKVLDYLKRRTS